MLPLPTLPVKNELQRLHIAGRQLTTTNRLRSSALKGEAKVMAKTYGKLRPVQVLLQAMWTLVSPVSEILQLYSPPPEHRPMHVRWW